MDFEIKYKRDKKEKFWTLEKTSLLRFNNLLDDLFSKTDMKEVIIRIRKLDVEDKEVVQK